MNIQGGFLMKQGGKPPFCFFHITPDTPSLTCPSKPRHKAGTEVGI